MMITIKNNDSIIVGEKGIVSIFIRRGNVDKGENMEEKGGKENLNMEKGRRSSRTWSRTWKTQDSA